MPQRCNDAARPLGQLPHTGVMVASGCHCHWCDCMVMVATIISVPPHVGSLSSHTSCPTLVPALPRRISTHNKNQNTINCNRSAFLQALPSSYSLLLASPSSALPEHVIAMAVLPRASWVPYYASDSKAKVASNKQDNSWSPCLL